MLRAVLVVAAAAGAVVAGAVVPADRPDAPVAAVLADGTIDRDDVTTLADTTIDRDDFTGVPDRDDFTTFDFDGGNGGDG